MRQWSLFRQWRIDAIQRPLESQGFVEWPHELSTASLGMPARPSFVNAKGCVLSSEELITAEEAAVEAWAVSVTETSGALGVSVCAFEERASVWRSLWQLMEQSDVLVVVADARLPPFFVPATLVRAAKRKGAVTVLVLNKAELSTPAALKAWQAHYTCGGSGDSGGGGPPGEDVGSRSRAPVDFDNVLAVSAESAASVGSLADLLCSLASSAQASAAVAAINLEKGGGGDRPKNVVVGLVGEPNAGKSSTINALMKRWGVAVQAAANITPGRTKHNQTFEVPSRRLTVLDSPGVSWPKLGVSLPLAVAMGAYPVSQVREPLSVVRFLAERTGADALLRAFKLDRGPRAGKRLLLDIYGETDEAALGPWSPHMLAEAIGAGKKIVGKGGRVDVHAASLKLIKFALLGIAPLVAVAPPVDGSGGCFACVAGGVVALRAGTADDSDESGPDGESELASEEVREAPSKATRKPRRAVRDEAPPTTKGSQKGSEGEDEGGEEGRLQQKKRGERKSKGKEHPNSGFRMKGDTW
jgi:ribosome biogenesis GTPase A